MKAAADVVRLNPFDPGAHYVLVSYLRSSGRKAEALREYDRIAKLFPWLSEPLIAKGEFLLVLDQADEAGQSFQAGLMRDSSNADLYVRCAMAFSSRGQFSRALEFYDQALKSQPHSVNALVGKADVLVQLGSVQDASRLYREAIAIGVDVATPHAHLGKMLADSGNFLGAIAEYDSALYLEPMRADLYIEKANKYLSKSDNTNAFRVLWQAERRGLNTPEILVFLGFASCKKKDFPLAEQYFQQAANDAPNSASPLFEFAFCLYDQDQRPAASEKLRKALDLDPDFLPYYGSADQAPRSNKDIQDAINELNERVSGFEPDVQSKLKERITRFQRLLKQ